MNAEAPGSQDKFRRYRAAKKARGLKEIRMWLPDTKRPEFKAQLAQIEKELHASEEEREIAHFMEEALNDALKDIPPL